MIREVGAYCARYVLPLVCMAGSAWFIYQSQNEQTDAKRQRDKAATMLKEAQDAKTAQSLIGQAAKDVSQRESSQEESQFFAGLRKHAAKVGATVLKLSTTSEQYPADPPSLKGLTRISTHITAVGSYPALYKFIQSLAASQRLYTFSDSRWTRDEAGNRLSFSLTRYVESAPATENRSK